jgi:predicted nucleotidyltransferase
VFCVKDFVATAEGLVFAVVENGLENGRVRCFLRYQRTQSGWQKLSTAQANLLLTKFYPQYQFYSTVLDTHLHAVAVNSVTCHFQPKLVLQQLLAMDTTDAVQLDCRELLFSLMQQGLDVKQLGLTGSLLIGAQNNQSDIDLVFYDKLAFQHAREIIQKLIVQKSLSALNDDDWQDSYARRACALDLTEYIWHERRKFNKAMINGRKFDISLVDAAALSEQKFEKQGQVKFKSKVVDATRAFEYPAQFVIDHKQIKCVVSYTATYTGQAFAGESVEISGQLEQSERGVQRVVVGSNREAAGEYIKVIQKIT